MKDLFDITGEVKPAELPAEPAALPPEEEERRALWNTFRTLKTDLSDGEIEEIREHAGGNLSPAIDIAALAAAVETAEGMIEVKQKTEAAAK